MIMARDEPLADPRLYRRLQVVCGDASSAHMATLLKVGTTLIALRLIRHRATPRLLLDDAVSALQTFSADPTLRATAPSNTGRVRAVDVQRAWLHAAHRFHDRVGLPPQEAELLAPWDEVLTSLESDPYSAADRVDWVAKLALLQRLVEREQISWSNPRVTALDLAYHDVRADRSLYGRLVRAGKMRSLVDPAEVARLRQLPPPGTRAAARGTLIRLIRRCGYRYEVNWTTCQFTAGSQRVELLLDDPLSADGGVASEVIARLERRAARGSDDDTDPWPLGAGRPSGGEGDGELDGLGWWSSVAG
jgi:proteasome accessory factor A